MTESTFHLSEAAQDFTWLLDKFAHETAGVVDVIAVSADGLLMASAGEADQAASGAGDAGTGDADDDVVDAEIVDDDKKD